MWKPFFYQVSYKYNNEVLLFNSFTGAIFRFSNNEFQLIQNNLYQIESSGNSDNEDIFNFLKENCFIIPKNVNERELLHSIFLTNKFSEEKIMLLIAPTFRCNLSCEYCFQKNLEPYNKTDMTFDIKNYLIEFFNQKAKKCKEISVSWFGGEPLLAYDIIEELSNKFMQISQKREIKYQAQIVTNGSLLTKELVKKFPSIGINSIEIPIDGTPKAHAQRKGVSIEKSGRFFSRLIECIPTILNKLDRLTIRINVDRDNEKEAYFIPKLLSDLSINHPKIDIQLARTCSNEHVKEIENSIYLTLDEYAEKELSFRRYMDDLGFETPHFINPIPRPCSAILQGFFVIDPQGYLYKCTPRIGKVEESMGNIKSINKSEIFSPIINNYIPYINTDPWTDKKCYNCRLIPICVGSCAIKRYLGQGYCTYHKKNLAERLDLMEKHLSPEKNHELASYYLKQYSSIMNI